MENKRNDYFNDPAISRGYLLNFKTSPRTGEVLSKEKKDTSAMTFGRAFHSYMEGGDIFFSEFFVMPSDAEICEEIGGKVPRNTSLYKAWKLDQEEAANSREVISEEDFKMIETMAQNVFKSEFYSKIFEQSKYNIETEKAVFAEIEGKKYKCLCDVYIDRGDDILVIDWKSTRMKLTADPIKMMYEIKKWDLHFQQVHYSKVITAATGKPVVFCFFFSENHGANECLPIVIDPKSDLITESSMDWETANKNLEDFQAGNIWGIDSKIKNGILIID